MRRRRVAYPYAGAVRPCTEASVLRPRIRARAVRYRKNDLENAGTALQERATALGSVQPLSSRQYQLFLRFEAVKNASDRVGGQLGRRDLGNPLVLVHRLLGALQQLIDTDGPLRIKVGDADAE